MTDRSWFREFCENSTLPCVQYIVMKQRALIEKTYWTLTFLTLISITIYASSVVAHIWITDPTVMYIENTESRIQEIPFPSIRVCPSYHLRKNVWERHMSTNNSYWEQLQQYYSNICAIRGSFAPLLMRFPLNYYDYDLLKNIVSDSSMSCREMIRSVIWQNDTIPDLCNYVQPVMGIYGICYIINMLPMYQLLNSEYYYRYSNFFSKNSTYLPTKKTKWNLDDGYATYSKRSILLNIIPARTNGFSYYHRLRLSLHTLHEEFLNCSSGGLVNDFFIITLSSPAEYVALNSRSFIVPDTYTKIHITPFVKKINLDIKGLSPSVRKCYLHNERKLSIFQHYTERNCNYECLINKTISTCGCVSFYDAYLVQSSDNIICGPAKSECIVTATKSTYHQQDTICNCLPTCTVLDYEVAQTTHYDDWAYLKRVKLENNNSIGATVEIVFKYPYFTAYKSESVVDIGVLISIVGGLLSILIGFNVVNLFEIFFVVIQMTCNYVM